MHNLRALLVSIIEILVKHSVLVPANKLNGGVTVNRCWQSDEMKDSRSILEETDSDAAAMRLFKVVHNQAKTVTDLLVKRGRAQNNNIGVWDGSYEYKGRSLFVRCTCFMLRVYCRPQSPLLLLVTTEHEDSEVWGREWLRYFYSLARWGGGRGRELGLG